MALTVTSRGTSTHNTGATTLVPNGRTATLAAGSMGVLCMALDNAGTAGSALIAPDSWTDAKGNIWTLQQNALYDNGAASAGIEMAIYTAPITVALLTTDAGTMTWKSGSPVAKAWTWYEAIPSTGSVSYLTGGTIAGATAANAQVVTATVPVGDAVIAGYFSENVNAVTGDSDTTNGTWTAQQTNTVGSGTSGVRIATQQKVQTTTPSTQSYDVTVASQDRIAGYIILHELVNTTVTPGVASLTTARFAPTVTVFDPTPSDAYGIEVWADTPAAWYRMGEASGAVLDYMGGASGTVSGTVTRDAAGLSGTGADGSIDFDGSSGRVVVSDAAKFSLATTGELTIEALVSPDAIGSTQTFVHKGAAGQFEYNLAQLGAGTFRFILWDIDGNDRLTLTSTSTISEVGERAHIAVSLDDATDTAVLYFNGAAEDTETTWASTSTDGTGDFVIGRREDSAGEHFNGKVDEVAVYASALTDARILSHAEAAGLITGTTVTPGVASVTTTRFAPTVTATDHKSVTPSTASLATSTFAPTVTASNHQLVTPGVATLTTARFAPTVSATANQTVVPGVAAITTSTFAPTVATTAHQTVTPTTAALSMTAFAPTATVTDHRTVVPGVAALATSAFAPTVSATAHQTVTPATASLALTTFAPGVAGGQGLTIVPGLASLQLTAFAPDVEAIADVVVTPSTRALAMTAFAPNVVATDHKLLTPSTASLGTTLFAPTVLATEGTRVTPSTASLILAAFAPTVTGSAEPLPLPRVTPLGLTIITGRIVVAAETTNVGIAVEPDVLGLEVI